jgi:hypothetical protein
MRLNKRPIFICGFAHGGSNIFLNLLRSHPGVCSPRGELNEVFKGKPDESWPTRLAKIGRYLPFVLLEGGDIFRFKEWRARRPFKAATQDMLDRVFYREKFRARDESQNLYKTEKERYTDEEIASSRLLVKYLDGLIFISAELARMYPDATFFGLVRNGFAVCEGHVRRGHHLETIARNYDRGCKRMIEDSERIPNYHLARYEDIIAKPLEFLKEIYRLADLDIKQVRQVRLENKRVIQRDGSHGMADPGKGWKEMSWHSFEEFPKHLRTDANENQIRRLTPEQQALILEYSRDSLARFGYLPQVAGEGSVLTGGRKLSAQV